MRIIFSKGVACPHRSSMMRMVEKARTLALLFQVVEKCKVSRYRLKLALWRFENFIGRYQQTILLFIDTISSAL